MKSIKEMNASELLQSFNVGQGKTNELPDIASINKVDDSNIQLSYDGNSANVTQSWLEAFSLMQLHRELKDLPVERQEKVMTNYNAGFLSLNHRLNNEKSDSKPITGHYLTSESYLSNAFKINANADILQSIFAIANGKFDSKADFSAAMQSISKLCLTETQQTTYESLVTKEQTIKQVKEDVLTVVDNFTLLSETEFKVSVNPSDLTKVVETAGKHSFDVKDADFNKISFKMDVSFSKKPE